MWGGIITEISFLSNFHVGFNNTKSDILIHLTQWQYWWWFWFSYFWVLYFLLFMRIFRYRILKFKPRIATTYRPHGKWGDLIVCLIPVSWCVNIITNSNFILRMIEWQAESSLFTLRVRGKQWYWVYKYELKILTDILTPPKNIGNSKWVISNLLDLQVADDYLSIHRLRSQSNWINAYWNEYLDKDIKDLATVSSTSTSALYNEFVDTFKKSSSNGVLINPPLNLENLGLKLRNAKKISIGNSMINTLSERDSFYDEEVDDQDFYWGGIFNRNLMRTSTLFNDEFVWDEPIDFLYVRGFIRSSLTRNFENLNSFEGYFFGHSEAHESARQAKRGQSPLMPLRIIKYPLNYVNSATSSDLMELFRLRFNTEQKHVEMKINPHQTQWIFKQKRYKRLSALKSKVRYYTDENGDINPNLKFTYQPYVYKNRLILSDDKNYYTHYQIFKKNKHRSEDIRLPFNKRLLRTKRIVVLPAHVNLTVITNSFDVVHSWFIPGLGLKMDCIPGRSTHHVLHIDNVGFYYGQCAEICGRYHHHMPIRICALPFEHFLVWWHAFGLPKLLYTQNSKKDKYLYGFRKYVW